MMARPTHVPEMMNRVEAALADAGGIHFVTPQHSSPDMVGLRHLADVQVEFASGPGRPVIGAGIRFGKRMLRRALRWYVVPMMEQQSRFNHAVLDALDRLQVQNERVVRDVEALRMEGGQPPSPGG
jgi:hypothetical protein